MTASSALGMARYIAIACSGGDEVVITDHHQGAGADRGQAGERDVRLGLPHLHLLGKDDGSVPGTVGRGGLIGRPERLIHVAVGGQPRELHETWNVAVDVRGGADKHQLAHQVRPRTGD